MKNIVILGVLSLTVFTFCTKKKPTHKEKLQEVIEVYIADMLKNEPILEYSIDSIDISNITQAQKLEKEAFEYRDLALKTMDEIKGLGVRFKDTKSLRDMMTDLTNGKKDAFTESSNNDLVQMKTEFKELETKAKEYSELSQELANKSLKADSTIVIYYKVFARSTVTSIKNVQKNAIFPFHISKDYKILKEPLEFKKS